MGKNIGWLQSSNSPESDNCYTPQYVVNAILKYIPNTVNGNMTGILCPFDKASHSYPKVFRHNGYNVLNTHYNPKTGEGKSFFDYTPDDMEGIDYIVSNPPYSIKDKVLEHAEYLNKPYAFLLPLPTLQGLTRFKNVFYKNNTEVLIFADRIPFSTETTHWSEYSGNHFGSVYICKNVLPEKLIFQRLVKENDLIK